MSTPDTHNPYLANRTAHNDRYTNLAKSKWNWQLTTGALLLANVGLSSGIVYVSSQQKIQPYIVEANATGVAAAYHELQATSIADPRVVSAALSDFILKIRRLSTDTALLKTDTDKAFSMCLGPAQTYIRAYYSENPSAETLKHGPVYPRNILVVPRTEKSWSASWDEETQNLEGQPIAIHRWEALIEIALILPTNKAERETAPTGLWVERIQWNERS